MRRVKGIFCIPIFILMGFEATSQTAIVVSSEVISAENIDRLELIKTLQFDELVFDVSFSDEILAVSGEKSIFLFDVNALDTSPQLLKPEDETVDIPSIAFNPDGNYLADSSIFLNADGSVHIWDIGEKSLIATFAEPETAFLNLSFSPDGMKLAGADGSAIYIFDAIKWELSSTFQIVESPRAVAFSPDGTQLAVSAASKGLHVLEVNTGEVIYSNQNVYPTDLTFSINGYGVIFGTVSSGVGVVDLEYAREAYFDRQSIARQPMPALALSPDGSLVLTGDRGGQVQLWQIFPPEEFIVTTVSDTYVSNVAFNRAGTMIAVVYGNKQVELWGILAE
jgi:WD40 repeat protein